MDSARKVVEERIALLAKDGRVTAEAVLADAEDLTSPLHALFEWDDSKAAREHRLEQARAVIRSVKIEVETETHTVSVVRYVKDPTTKSGYVETLRLRDSKELAREALRAEITRVVAQLERAHDIARVLDLDEEVQDVIDRVKDLRRHVAA